MEARRGECLNCPSSGEPPLQLHAGGVQRTLVQGKGNKSWQDEKAHLATLVDPDLDSRLWERLHGV